MPNTKSAKRRMRSNVRKQAHNTSIKSRLHIGRGGQFLDANMLAGLDATERTQLRPGALAFQNFERLILLAHGTPRVGRLKPGFKK